MAGGGGILALIRGHSDMPFAKVSGGIAVLPEHPRGGRARLRVFGAPRAPR